MLVLVATVARFDGFMHYIGDVWSRLLQPGVDRETGIREQLGWMYTDQFFENTRRVEQAVKVMSSNPYPQPAHGWDCQIAAWGEFDTTARLGQITMPTLVVVGRQDILTRPRLSEALATGIPNAELVVLDDGAHLLNFEIADRFNRTVLDFLARVDGEGMEPRDPQQEGTRGY